MPYAPYPQLLKILRSKIAWLMFACLAVDGILYAVSPKQTLDQKLFYTGDQARALLEAFSAADHLAYTRTECVDLVFIALYTALFITLFRFFRVPFRFRHFAWIPGLFDGFETVGILGILLGKISPTVLDGLGYATFGKWIFSAVALLLIIHHGRKVR